MPLPLGRKLTFQAIFRFGFSLSFKATAVSAVLFGRVIFAQPALSPPQPIEWPLCGSILTFELPLSFNERFIQLSILSQAKNADRLRELKETLQYVATRTIDSRSGRDLLHIGLSSGLRGEDFLNSLSSLSSKAADEIFNPELKTELIKKIRDLGLHEKLWEAKSELSWGKPPINDVIIKEIVENEFELTQLFDFLNDESRGMSGAKGSASLERAIRKALIINLFPETRIALDQGYEPLQVNNGRILPPSQMDTSSLLGRRIVVEIGDPPSGPSIFEQFHAQQVQSLEAPRETSGKGWRVNLIELAKTEVGKSLDDVPRGAGSYEGVLVANIPGTFAIRVSAQTIYFFDSTKFHYVFKAVALKPEL